MRRKDTALKDIFYGQGLTIEDKSIAGPFVLQGFGQGGCGGKEQDRVAVDCPSAQTGGNKYSGKRVSGKINPFSGNV